MLPESLWMVKIFWKVLGSPFDEEIQLHNHFARNVCRKKTFILYFLNKRLLTQLKRILLCLHWSCQWNAQSYFLEGQLFRRSVQIKLKLFVHYTSITNRIYNSFKSFVVFKYLRILPKKLDKLFLVPTKYVLFLFLFLNL